MAAVGGDAVDGALVALQLSQGAECVRVPQLEHPASAAAQQGRRAGDDAQRTHPVPVGVGDLLWDRRKQKYRLNLSVRTLQTFVKLSILCNCAGKSVSMSSWIYDGFKQAFWSFSAAATAESKSK